MTAVVNKTLPNVIKADLMLFAIIRTKVYFSINLSFFYSTESQFLYKFNFKQTLN
jgi:hypothetical protein